MMTETLTMPAPEHQAPDTPVVDTPAADSPDLPALLREREALARQAEEAIDTARGLREAYAAARDRGDVDDMATLRPRVDAADDLARAADAMLGNVSRRVREIQLGMEAEQDLAARRARLVETGERMADARGAYFATLRRAAAHVQALAGEMKQVHDARAAAVAAYQAERAAFPRYPALSFDTDLAKTELEISTVVRERDTLRQLVGDEIVGDLLWTLFLAAARPDEYQSRRSSNQVRSPLSF